MVKQRTRCIRCHACKYATKFWLKNFTRRDKLEDLKVDETAVLKWTLEKWDVRKSLNSTGSG
jgi:Fe-S-cluster-containing dehydrogenase component